MDEELDTTSQAVEALLFLSTDQGNAPNGIRRPARQISKAVSARQSDNGFDGRVHKKGRHTKVTPRPTQEERSVDVKPVISIPRTVPYRMPRDPTRSTSSNSDGNPLASPISTSARILQQMALPHASQPSGNPSQKQSVKVQGIQHEVSAMLLERATTEPQLLSFRRTGKSLNLCMLYKGTPYAGYFALNAKANEELTADTSSRSSNGSQAALGGGEDDGGANDETDRDDVAGSGRGRRRRAAHNYAQLADGSAAASLAASRPSLDVEGKEKLSKQKEIDSQQEWLRMQAEGPANGAVCALCHGPEDICRTMEGNTPRASLPRHLGKLILARPSLKRMPCWVHEQCALWSADMYHSDAQSRPLLASLGAALRRGLGIACSACHRKGATVSCVYPLCKKVFHVGCAVSAHCHMDSAARWCTACPEHFSHAHHTLHTRMSQDPGSHMRGSIRRALSNADKVHRSQAHSDPQRSIVSDSGFPLPQMFMNSGHQFSVPGLPFPVDLEGFSNSNHGMLMNNLAMGGGMSNMMNSLRMRMQPHMIPSLEALTRVHHDAQVAAYSRVPPMQMPFDPMEGSSWLANSIFQDSMHSASALDGDDYNDDGLASGNRCSVCRVQRKGRCGTLSAPRSCLKRKKLEHSGISVPPGPPKTSRAHRDAIDS